jgi:cytochrome P450
VAEVSDIGINKGERLRNRQNATGVVNDPHSRYDELREAYGDVVPGSVAHQFGVQEPVGSGEPGVPHFTIIGYDTGDAVFRRHDVFSSQLGYAGGPLGRTMLGMDEPDHRRYRALVQPAFALRTMTSWRDRWLIPVLDTLIDSFQGQVQADLYYDYCAKFPATTIGSAFGASPADIAELHDIVLQAGGNADSLEDVEAARGRLAAYLGRIMDDRRTKPGEDVISLLVNSQYVAEDGSDHQLSDDEVLGFADLMLTAGSGTTYRTMGIMLLALLQRPDLYELVLNDRSMVVPLVEETLRWEAPVAYFGRVAKVDTELNGTTIPAGARVQVVISAANHDPRRWERPHEFDPFRAVQPHLAFASGPHFCIGNQLARMELGEALNRILDRVPDIRLDGDQPPPYITGLLFRMPTGLPVVIGA